MAVWGVKRGFTISPFPWGCKLPRRSLFSGKSSLGRLRLCICVTYMHAYSYINIILEDKKDVHRERLTFSCHHLVVHGGCFNRILHFVCSTYKRFQWTLTPFRSTQNATIILQCNDGSLWSTLYYTRMLFIQIPFPSILLPEAGIRTFLISGLPTRLREVFTLPSRRR